jgi:uncharacterized damage-inducible protein DinB
MATRSQILRKEQVLSNWLQARQSILAEVSRISETQHDEIFLGIWSIKDLLAHLTGWDRTNLDAVKSVLEGRVPSFYRYRDRDWKTYNAMLVEEYKRDSSQELLDSVHDSQQQLAEFLKALPPEAFNQDFGVRFRGYKVTIQRLLEADAEDAQTHLRQIIDYFQKPT